MKKLLLIISIPITLESCNEKEKPNIYESKNRKMDNILKRLENNYSNYKNNELVRSEFTADLNSRTDSIFENKVFDDIPLTVFKISKNKYGDGMIVHLYANNKYNPEDSPSKYLTFDIFGFISEEKAKKINEKETYLVSGHNIHRLNHQQTSIITNLSYYAPETNIELDAYDDNYLFNIGHAVMEIDKLIPAGY